MARATDEGGRTKDEAGSGRLEAGGGSRKPEAGSGKREEEGRRRNETVPAGTHGRRDGTPSSSCNSLSCWRFETPPGAGRARFSHHRVFAFARDGNAF